MKKNFYNFLTSISNLPPTEQEHALETQFQQWRGRNAQTDDILVVGIKV
jgi:mRNA-degrading endonuclease YafQ of YafQ-DinJ toxin-antitoxin module